MKRTKTEYEDLVRQQKLEIRELAGGLLISEHFSQREPMIRGSVLYLKPSVDGRAKAIEFLRNLRTKELLES